MKRTIAALAVLLAAVVTVSAQTSGPATTPEAPAKTELPAAVATSSDAPDDAQPQELILPHMQGQALEAQAGLVLPLPAPRWAGLQPQSSAHTANGRGGFNWETALQQSLLFLGVQHGYALTQAKTRRELKGPFWRDYFRSVAYTSGWADGGRFFTNYISHPMQGAISGYIQVQNDPHGRSEEFGRARSYWVSRMKAMAWTAAYSTQFEIGPISQSSIGNVGLHTSLDGKKRKMAYGDMVVTPTLGTAWLVGEDVLDRYLVRWVEGRSNRLLWRGTTRVLFNPMRAAANLIRFKTPWYRDR